VIRRPPLIPLFSTVLLVSVGSDNTTTLSVRANWQSTRTLGLGCNLSRTSRGGGGALATPYDANSTSCFGSLTLN
jgi:hypothetical protein